jgi:outer membrane protein assembly factor BamB
MRLYFFPALLPLAPLLPALLAALSAIAGGLRVLKRRKGLSVAAALLLVAAAATLAWQRARLPSQAEGSRLTPVEALPRPTPLTDDRAQQERARHGALFERWSRLNVHRALSAAAVGEDLLVVGTMDGDLLALSRRSGQGRWSLKKAEPILSSAAALGGTLFVGEGLHTAVRSGLTAIEAQSGKVLWQREFLGHIESAPAVDAARGRVYTVSGPQGLWALDARDGSVRWHARLGHVDSTPLLDGQSLWVAAQPEDGKKQSLLHELDPDSGRSRASIVLPGQPWGDLRSEGDLLLLTTAVGQIGPAEPGDRGWSHAFSLKDRKLAWSVALETMPLTQSASSRELGLVFHTLKNGKVVALSLRDGRGAWTYDLQAPCLAPPTLIPARNLLAAVAQNGALVVLDARTGRLIARTEAGTDTTAAPVSLADWLWVASSESTVAWELGDR